MYIVIAGGGALGRELVDQLVEMKKDIVVIDQNKEVCDDLLLLFGELYVLATWYRRHTETPIWKMLRPPRRAGRPVAA